MAENEIKNITKRDGQVVRFDQDRITNAIFRAHLSLGGEDMDFAKKMSDKVVQILNQTYSDEDYPSVEDIQDVVIEVLDKEGYHDLAMSYQVSRFLLIAEWLERTADHATNIGEEIIYLVTGKRVKY